MDTFPVKLENYIEHTVLKPDVTTAELTKLFDEAREHNFLGVCINPQFVKLAKDSLQGTDVKVVTVIGFPLGANLTEVKMYESCKALEDGADELDMVIDLNAIKDKNYKRAEMDIAGVVKEAKSRKVKVILETDLLEKQEIIEACKVCISAGADFVKTSTGFVKNGVGATIENVKLMHETVSGSGLLVKASGGIRDREFALRLIEAGAARIGTSSGVKIVNG